MRLISWNCQGFGNWILDQDYFQDMQIICLVETWIVDNKVEKYKYKNYTIHYADAIKDKSQGHGKGGLMILIHEDFLVEILESSYMWIFIKIKNLNPNLIIGLVYLNPKYRDKECYEMLEDTINTIENDNPGCSIIMCGDYNSRIGQLQGDEEDIFEGTVLAHERKSMDMVVNARGRLLCELLSQHGLYCLNGRSPGDTPGSYTFVGKPGKSVNDYFITNLLNLSNVENMKVLQIETRADHFPLELTTYIQIRETENNKTTSEEETNNVVQKNCWTWKNELKQKYQEMIEEKMPSLLTRGVYLNTTVEYKEINKLIIGTAEKLNMKFLYRGNIRKRKHLWYDKHCHLKKRELRQVLRKCKTSEFDEINTQEFLKIRQEYREIITQAKKKNNNELKEKIASVKDSKGFWDTIKKFRPRKETLNKISLSSWKEYLQKAYPSKQLLNIEMFDARHPVLDEKIDEGELELALMHLKTNKAPGMDEVPNEFYKNLPNKAKEYLLTLFNKIFTTKDIPLEWSEAMLHMLYKKGERNNPENFRGIALINNICKLFMNIVQARVYEWADNSNVLDEGQAGFRKGRGCNDNLFTLYSAICVNIMRENRVYCCFIDFKCAFDRVPHGLLWKHLFHIGLSSHIVGLVERLYTNAKICIRTQGYGFTESVKMSIGLMQGLGISPLLFILFLSDLTEFLKSNGIEGIKLNNNLRISTLLYADDLVLLADSPVNLQKTLNIFDRYCKTKEMTVNVSKSKVMIFRKAGRVSNKFKFYLGNEVIEIVNQYLYLGVIFTPQACFRVNTTRAISKTLAASSTVNSIWIKSKVYCWNAKETIYKAMVKTVLLYAAEIWGPRYAEEIETAQVKYFKNQFYWPRNTPNYIVRNETGTYKIHLDIVEKMLKWWLKILLMEDHRYPKICLKTLIEFESRQPLNTKHNWAAQLREVLVKVGYEELYRNGTHEQIKENLEEILEKFKFILREEDTNRINNSTYSSIYKETLRGGVERYLTLDTHINKIRVVSQLRVAAKNCIRIYANRMSYKIDTEVICSLCGMLEEENLKHILFRCPMYTETRHLIRKYMSENLEESLINLLTIEDEAKLNYLYEYVMTMLKIRSFIMAE